MSKPKNINSEKTLSFIKPFVWGILFGLITIILLLFTFSIIITKIDLPKPILSVLSTISVGLGAFVASFICGKIMKARGLMIGIICGIFISIFILLIGVTVFHNPISTIGIIKLVVIIVSSLIGGVIGVNIRRKIK